jgi:Uma2 family endonuclease
VTSARPILKFTYADYATLPETGPRYQLIGGELIKSPAPSYRHQTLLMRIAHALYAFVEPRKLGIVRMSPLDVILSDEDVAQPDAVYVSNIRVGIIVKEGLRGAPDLCIEILSDRTAGMDRVAKRGLYAKKGVLEYWIVDPHANIVELYRLQENAEQPATTFKATDTLTTPLLSGFSLGLPDVFAP